MSNKTELETSSPKNKQPRHPQNDRKSIRMVKPSKKTVTPASSAAESNPPVDSSHLHTSAKTKWKSLQTDLRSALDTWKDLEYDATEQKSPEEEQLEKVKSLIEDLKLKLNEF